MKRRLRQLHADQGGFSLTELLVSMLIGTVLLMAALMLLDRSTAASSEIADRQETVQRGRQAMQVITRTIRSQVCLGDPIKPIVSGDPNHIQFYADLGDGTQNVQLRTIRYDDTLPKKPIVEQVVEGVGTYPALTFGGAPTQRTILERVERTKVGSTDQPIFRFYAFATGGLPGDFVELPTPLSATDTARVALVKIAYVAMPDRGTLKDLDSTTLYGDVYVRLVDPSRPQEGPRCL